MHILLGKSCIAAETQIWCLKEFYFHSWKIKKNLEGAGCLWNALWTIQFLLSKAICKMGTNATCN